MQFIEQYMWWIIGINLILMVGIKYFIKFFTSKKEEEGNKFKFRLINAAFIVLLLMSSLFKTHQETFISIFLTLFILYIAVLTYELMAYFILIRSGTKMKMDNVESRRENHNTRIMSLLVFIFITFITLVLIIKVWGFESALQTGGFLGFILVPIVFTANYWGPDLIGGIFLLNNKFLNDGDTIEFRDNYYMVYKFGFFQTILKNFDNNSRTFVKNSQMRDEPIQNLNKPASVSGVRQLLKYTIPYKNDEDYEAYFKKLDDAVTKVQERFYEASKTNGFVNDKVDIDFNISKPADYGIDIVLAYYLNDISQYKTTKKLREVLNKPRTNFHKAVLIEFQKKDIYVDTPILIENTKPLKPKTTQEKQNEGEKNGVGKKNKPNGN